MVLNSVDVLVDALREANLLRADHFEKLVNEIAPEFEDTQELAKHVVKIGWITLHQAKKLLSGHGQELILGNYVITDKIGEGGMGKVYKANQLRLSRTVALKVIRPNLLSNDTALKRFQREAKAAAQLAHPNIVRLFDADQVGDRHFLAMEFVNGTDLSKLVKDAGPLPIGMACSFTQQAAAGLQHAHDLGLVHRDIKPSNLLVTAPGKAGKTGSGGVVKILDMGLARAVGDATNESDLTALTQAGTVIGTPDYMSPEQAKNSSTVDGRSDIYSLGCTFFFLLTGRTLFPNGSTLEKLLQHQMDAPPHIQLLRPEIPDELAVIIHRLLAKQPEGRFQSGAALAAALEPWSIFDPNLQRHKSGEINLKPKIVALPPPASIGTAACSADARTQGDPFNFDEMDEATPLPATQAHEPKTGRPARKPSWLWWGAGALGILCLAVAGLLIAKKLNQKDEPSKHVDESAPIVKEDTQPKKEAPPPNKKTALDAVSAYLPLNTSAVIVLNLPQLTHSGIYKKRLEAQIEPVLGFIKFTAKFDPIRSIERIVVAMPPSGGDGTIVLYGQSSLAAELKRWMIRDLSGRSTTEVSPEGFRYTVLQFRFEKNKPLLYAALLNQVNTSTIAISESRKNILETLARADESSRDGGKNKKPFNDPSISSSLAKYDKYELNPPVLWCCLGTQLRLPGKNSLKDEFGILSLVANVHLGEGIDFDAFVEAPTYGEATSFVKLMQEVLTVNLGRNRDQRVANLVELVAKMKQVPGSKGLGKQSPATLHIRRHMTENELVEWLKPFIGDPPTDDMP
jgi:serine/threonine protein kinase